MAEVAGYYYVVCNASRRSASVMPMFKKIYIIQLQQRTAKEELTKQKYQAEREQFSKGTFQFHRLTSKRVQLELITLIRRWTCYYVFMLTRV